MSYGLSYRRIFLKAKAQVTDFDKYPKDAAWDPIGIDLWLEKHLHLRPYTHNSSSGSFQKETNCRIPLGPRQLYLSGGKAKKKRYTPWSIFTLPNRPPYYFCKHRDLGAIVLDKQGQSCGLLIIATEQDFGQKSDLDH